MDLFHLAVAVTALVWLSMLGAAAIPGTRWVDPEFDPRVDRRSDPGSAPELVPVHRRLGPPQLRLALALLGLLVVAEVVRFG